jgi:hypothetical protein
MFAKLQALWLKIPENYRKEVVSFLTTFASVFVLSVVTAYNTDPSTLEAGALAAVFVSALRSGLKAAINVIFFPPTEPTSTDPNQV